MLVLAMMPSMALAMAEGRFERTLQVNGPQQVEISTGSGSVRVRAGQGKQVHIVGIIKVSTLFGGEDKVKQIEQNPPIAQSGSLIRIGGQSNSSFLWDNVSISYEVEVPADTTLRASTGSGSEDISDIAAAVTAKTGSGSIRLLNINGAVRANTGSGEISATSLKGNLEASTGSGRIEVRQSQLGDVEASTGSGAIRVDSMRGLLRARTGSGGIDVSGLPTSGWEISSGSGSINLRVPPEQNFDVNLSTSSGSIHVDRQLSLNGGEFDRHKIAARVGGGGPLVRVHTSSGSINIR